MRFISIISSFHYSTLVEEMPLEKLPGARENMDNASVLAQNYIIKYQLNNEKLGWN